jgi:hypothetical protein
MSKWFQPGVAIALGAVVWAAFWTGGNPGAGALSFAVMAGFGALLLLGGRSETIRGMRGDGRDERWAMIDLRATALAGVVLITAVIVGFVVEIARGNDGSPYTWLGALAGITYLVGLLIDRWRS